MKNDIFEERQAFNFYKSYYKTSLLLDTENRAEFLDCILHYQFTGELKQPVLPMASLAFNGQLHSLNKQVNGFIRGKETYPNGNPTKGSGKAKGKGKGKEVQEKEEVQEEEKEENNTLPAKAENIDFKKLIEFINKKTGRDFKVINKTVKGKYLARLKDGYSKQDILNAVSNAVKNDYHKGENFKYLTPEFFSRAETLDKYSNTKKEPEKPKPQNSAITYSGPFHN